LSSGGTIYGNKHGFSHEKDPPSPISFYGFAKFQIEEMILFYHRRYGLNYLILRPSNPFGYGQNLFGKQGLIAVLMGKIITDSTAVIFGDGLALRDYIYINDFTYYIAELLKNNILNITLNIGSGKGYSVKQIIKFVEETSNKKLNFELTEPRENDVKEFVLDISLLNKLIPHKQADIISGIKDFYRRVVLL
jgi:UDP-glucose 4-epimerase